ncbi:helix-hairpin-helix domain-containing protein [candidate division KSB1 bacterium]|nr:helix-hairpin-helix domain-containing protein [candidate division KSB1 bacterium]
MAHWLKNFMYLMLLNIALVVHPDPGYSQDTHEEDLYESQEETADQSDLAEQLEQLRAAPIDFNRATVEMLQTIPFVLPIHARLIQRFRELKGHFQSLDDLRNVPGLPAELPDLMAPYIAFTTTRKTTGFPLQISTRSRFKQKLEPAVGYQSQEYFNSPLKFYQRWKLNWNSNYELGLLFEKDSGERNYNDFQAYYLDLKELPLNGHLVFGNYSVKIGQGLGFWGPYGMGLSADPILPNKKFGRAIQPYGSVSETGALHGGAGQFQLGHFSALFFSSRRKLDASVDSTGKITGINESGNHRNTKELARVNRISEQIYGASLALDLFTRLQMGFTYSRQYFESTFPLSDSLRQLFQSLLPDQTLLGLDFHFFWKQLHFFGEWVQNQTGPSAWTLGAMLGNRSLVTTWGYRNYTAEFQNRYGRAFGQFSAIPANETGFFMGIRYRFPFSLVCRGFFDVSRSPWRTYFEPMPVNSRKVLLDISTNLLKNWEITAHWRYSYQEKKCDVSDEFGHQYSILAPFSTQSVRLNLSFRLSAQFLLSTRLEKKWSGFGPLRSWQQSFDKTDAGWLLYHNVQYKPWRSLTLAGRICFFDSPGYENRLYTYENDLPGLMTNQMLSGRGSRNYLLCKYEWRRFLKVGLKYASIFYDDRQTVGSGSDLINSNVVQELSGFFDWAF